MEKIDSFGHDTPDGNYRKMKKIPAPKKPTDINPKKIAAIMGALAIAGISGAGYYAEKERQSPEYKQQIAQTAAAEKADREKSEEMLQQAFREAPKHGEYLYSIDVKKIVEACQLRQKWTKSEETQEFCVVVPAFEVRSKDQEQTISPTDEIMEKYFHFFKEAHPDLEIIGIMKPDTFAFPELLDKQNQLIIIPAPKSSAQQHEPDASNK